MKKNRKVFIDIILNLICMIYIIYRWILLESVGVAASRTHDDGETIMLIIGATIALIVFLVIDIISLISAKKQKGYLLPGYVGVSIGIKGIAILFLILAYIFKLKI